MKRQWFHKHGTDANASVRVREYMDREHGHHLPKAKRARRWMGQKKPRRMARMCRVSQYMLLPGICFTARPCKTMTRVNDGRWWLCQ